MSTRSNVDSTSPASDRPTKRRRLASPIELTPSAPEPALVTPDATVTPPSPPLPLTRENLRALTRMASAGPSTPGNKGSASQSSTSKPSSTVPADIRSGLEHYNIFVNCIELTSKDFDSQLANFVTQKVMSTRSSPAITKEKHQEIVSLYKRYEGAVEATISAKLKDHIFTKPEFLQNDTELLESTEQSQFRTGSVPIPDTSGDYNWARLLKGTKVPERPVPDLMYGLVEKGLFSKKEITILGSLEHTTRVAKTLYFPFLTVEWKSESHGGNPHIARSQAARSGAAIVNDMRNLYAEIAPDREPEKLGYTNLAVRTACFSCIICGWFIQVWVHWFRIIKGGVIEWHSTLICSTRVEQYQDDFTQLHRVLHNIIDWGTTERLYQIREVLAKIDAQRREEADLDTGKGKGKVARKKRKTPPSSPAK